MPGADVSADRSLQLGGERDVSLRHVARFSGIPESSLYSVTSRRGELSAQNLRKLCVAMKVSSDWILGIGDER